MAVITESLRVQGMFCTNCETRIQSALLRLPGVETAEASFEKETVTVHYDPVQSDRAALLREITALGYSPTETRGRYVQIVSVLVILLAVYLIAAHLGWTQVFNLFPTIETSLSLGMLFVIGLLTSVHCIAMCGGINLTQSTLAAKRSGKVMRANVAYQLGRVVSYTLIGGIVGGVGSVLSPSGALRGVVAVAAGVLMLIMALQMLGVFKPLRRLRLHLPQGVYQRGARLLRGRSTFFIGLLNGLMPCGPLQSMQLYALSTGSVVMGALSMLLFSLGTVPLMLGFGFLSGKLNRKYAKVMLTVSACLIFVMGLHMAGNGLSLSGVSLLPKSSASQLAMVEGETQTVRTEVDYGGYEAITVHRGLPVTWTVYVPPGKLNGCNNELVAQEFSLDVKLTEGENVITFTPQETGTFPYTCWMGMIKSTIEVVE